MYGKSLYLLLHFTTAPGYCCKKKKTLKKEKTKTNKQQVHKPDLAEASLLTPQLAAGNAQIVKIWFSIHTSCTQHIFTEYLLLSVDETAV